MSPDRSEILEAFKHSGLRCTSQRYAIFDYLVRHPVHPSAEQVYAAVNRKDPRASLATVYKALHALAEAGLIRELTLDGNAIRFEAATTRHHHFICRACGRVEDVDWFELPQFSRQVSIGARKLEGYDLVLHGLCESCSSAT